MEAVFQGLVEGDGYQTYISPAVVNLVEPWESFLALISIKLQQQIGSC